MQPHIAVTLCVCCISLIGCRKKPAITERFDFDKVTSVVVYDFHRKAYQEGDPFNGSGMDIEQFNKTAFNLELFKKLIPQAKYKRDVFWKGGSLAVVKFVDGKELRLGISYYGSFFRIFGEKGYYVFEGEAAWEWRAEYRDRILNKILMPQRRYDDE